MHSWRSPAVPVLPLADRDLRPSATDSASRQRRTLGEGRRASLYVCGITPYDATHLGHAATYVTYDLLVRSWRDSGVEVTYAQNVTDVDDPLLERARDTGVDWRELAVSQTDLFRSDMEALRVIAPDHYLGAVETVPDVVRAVERLVADGAAYRVGPDATGAGDGDVYADLAADTRFGLEPMGDATDEAGRIAEFAAMGGDPDRPGKRAPLDPLLWRAAREGEPSWPGRSLGDGRPGWHVECATIAAMTLGAPVAVQGGGRDLRFPHHEMSTSHLRMLSGDAHPVVAQVHAGLLAYEGEKMSKSRGNLVLVSRLVEQGVEPMAVRLVLLSHHYASSWEFHEAELIDAAERLTRWRDAVALTAGGSVPGAGVPDSGAVVTQVRLALADDLDAPRALAAVDAWASAVLAADAADVVETGTATDGGSAPGALVRDAVDALLGIAL
ncbi:cysteine--1-D-myo-inosityl 2-amino-2-deoxy-alpha-D-glucopyranoside ligase [Serinibacter arcticus]|uniref:L-cysteine:1D-myo-inositol 2-amino-2-deoxy-alpha-D-glucopyranoside ligase n=1 Tax=Serinibacter arcticus TaxID=1655435 RepID=A0A2U1ZZ62_9MICO|nr:cysteine--1-D-myo-inosityl 2-amino-2-deoxy-alpha-D-glucopyranoside ligase [Serinibacter arcticus]PWD52275.1 cysteine--1-D-myo-inosityl 2-amino-2-deoxy-alpha-D-glucopyranoside ligase [Serinibacter arcticus]